MIVQMREDGANEGNVAARRKELVCGMQEMTKEYKEDQSVQSD